MRQYLPAFRDMKKLFLSTKIELTGIHISPVSFLPMVTLASDRGTFVVRKDYYEDCIGEFIRSK